MRSIERRFRERQNKHPERSTFVNFADATRREGFSQEMISRWFNKLVDKDDYDQSPGVKIDLVRLLSRMSNTREDDGNQTQKESVTGAQAQV